jgi:hypothetical protein
MTETDIKNKNLVLCTYLESIVKDYQVKAEFSTNDNDTKVIVCQEESGSKIVFFDNENPLFNYFTINTYGDNIKEEKETSVVLGNLIGKSDIIDFVVDKENQKWQLIFMQMTNPRAIQYMDIRRVGYTMTLKCIVNRIA